jgi:cbb3-type cytochrome oxidase subunit 1
MSNSGAGLNWLRIAAVYFVIGVSLGVHMGATHDFTLMPVHAHANLLGWVSMALFGLIHSRFPQLAAHWLATAHFWLYNLTVPLMLVALAMMLRGNEGIEPVVAVGSIGTGVAVLLFGINLVFRLRAE